MLVINAARKRYGGPVVSWSVWDGTDNSIPNVDLCVYFATPGNSLDEYGISPTGVLTGDDLWLTQVNGVPGATGSPIGRVLNGSNHYFSLTAAALTTLLTAKGNWSVFLELTAIGPDTAGGEIGFNTDVSAQLIVDHNVTASPRLVVDDADNGQDSDTTVDGLADGVKYWIGAWTENGVSTRMGFTTVKPTKLSNFDVTKRVVSGAPYDNFGNFGVGTIGYDGPTGYLGCKLHKLIIDSTCLINNAA